MQPTMPGFKKRKRESKKRGKLRGLGIGCYLEVTAAPGKELGAIHFEADGTVTIITGTLDFGMGHATTFAQILTDMLGVPFDRIRMVEGDSDRMAFGGGSGGSRSVMLSGAAITEAAARSSSVASKSLLTCWKPPPGDIEFQAGRFVIAGTDRSIGLMDLARRCAPGSSRRRHSAIRSTSTTSQRTRRGFPNGCHVAEVEVDPETGAPESVKYHLRQRLRHRGQSVAGGGPGARRRRARPRASLAGTGVYDCDGQL